MSGKKPLIQEIEQAQLKTDVPEFGAGDTVTVQVKVKEGTRERLQAFEGVVIGKRNRGMNSSFTVRKVSYGVGVERTFQTFSKLIDSISVKRRGDVRQAKLYYLRDLSGKAARIKEKLGKRAPITMQRQDRIDLLFTDTPPGAAISAMLDDKEIELVVAEG